MIIQYLINWESIKGYIEREEDLTLLRMRLYSLQCKIKANGVLIDDKKNYQAKYLNDTIHLVKSKINAQGLGLSDNTKISELWELNDELSQYHSLYNDYVVRCDNECSNFKSLVMQWVDNIKNFDVFQGVDGCVIIYASNLKEYKEFLNEKLNIECVELKDFNLEKSRMDRLRHKWRQGMSFSERGVGDGREAFKAFSKYLNTFAMTSYGVVEFIDPYWRKVALGNKNQERERWIKSTEILIKPFIQNPEINQINFVTVWESLENGILMTEGDFNEVRERLKSLICNNNKLKISIKFVMEYYRKDKNKEGKVKMKFHNRWITNEMRSVALLNGMDMFVGERLRQAELILFGPVAEDRSYYYPSLDPKHKEIKIN